MNKKMKVYAIAVVLCFLLLLDYSESEDCSDLKGEYDTTCPGENDPSNYDRCCWSNSTILCCPSDPYVFYSNIPNSTLAMIIGLSVIIACICTACVSILCCFWSPCPFFDTCLKYSYSDIIAHSDEKEGEPLNEPPEMADNTNHYSPCYVKMKKIEIV